MNIEKDTPSILSIDNNIFDEISNEVNFFLEIHKKVYLEANPGYGKTYHFAQLGNEIKKGDSIYKRLIFCTPRLIIQEQISNDLSVDFILNGDSKETDITDNDKIITSTFNSLHRIADIINENDLIIVDEAHELLRNFNSNYKKSTNPYYHKTLQTLYNANCSLVLMSGTPTYNFHELLGLKHLKINKNNEEKTSINVDFTKLKTKELAYRFCEKYSENFPKEKLHVIYIKNVNDCGEIALYLNEKGFNTEAITSQTKKEEVYLNIAKTDKISNNIQFIITTNVLSVGTNILNTNIGGVLMIDEYDPMEIKQFSKRFRKMKNLKIDIVNRFPKSKGFSKKRIEFTHKLNKKIVFKQIEVQHEIENSLSEQELLTFQNMSFEKNDLSSPKYIINQAIEKFLANESYLYEFKIKAINTPGILVDELNEYHDIEASISNDNKALFDDLNETISKEAKTLFMTKINSLIDDFICNKTKYIINTYSLIEHTEFEKREKYRELINKHLEHLMTTVKASDFSDFSDELINSQLFKKYIIEPLIEFIPYFENLDTCLRLIQKIQPEYRRKHILSIHTNQLIQKYCNIKKINYDSVLRYKREGEIFQDVKYQDKVLLDIIKNVFEYLCSSKVLHLHDLRERLINDKYIQSRLSKADKDIFPFNMITNENLNTNFLLGIANGIFIISNKKGIYKDRTGNPKRAFIFETDTSKFSNNAIFKNTIHKKKKLNSKEYSKIELTKLLSSNSSINRIFKL